MSLMVENLKALRGAMSETMKNAQGDKFAMAYLTVEACDSALMGLDDTSHCTYSDVEFMVSVQEQVIEQLEAQKSTLSDDELKVLGVNKEILADLQGILDRRDSKKSV